MQTESKMHTAVQGKIQTADCSIFNWILLLFPSLRVNRKHAKQIVTYMYANQSDILNNYMTNSVSGQDEPNLVLWLATWAGKMKLFCLVGIWALSQKENLSCFGVLSHIINPLLTLAFFINPLLKTLNFWIQYNILQPGNGPSWDKCRNKTHLSLLKQQTWKAREITTAKNNKFCILNKPQFWSLVVIITVSFLAKSSFKTWSFLIQVMVDAFSKKFCSHWNTDLRIGTIFGRCTDVWKD